MRLEKQTLSLQKGIQSTCTSDHYREHFFFFLREDYRENLTYVYQRKTFSLFSSVWCSTKYPGQTENIFKCPLHFQTHLSRPSKYKIANLVT